MRPACSIALAAAMWSAAAGAPPIPAPENVAAPPADATRTTTGVAMQILDPGSGSDRPSGNDCVVVTFTTWQHNGLLFSASGPNGQTSTLCLAAAMPGIAQALGYMTTGERRRLWIPAALTFRGEPTEQSTKPVDLTVDLGLIRILKAPPAPPNLSSPPPDAQRTHSGVALEILRPGSGNRVPRMENRVTVHYSGWTSQGVLFESTVTGGHPASVQLGTALPGWREALPLMKVGEKARIWIPANLAYGEHPSQKKVPAGNLVYEVELIGID